MVGIAGGYNLSRSDFSNEYDLAEYEKFIYGNNVLNKFNNERFVLNTDEYIVIFEGFLFDIYGFKNQKDYFFNQLNLDDLELFFTKLDGVFCFSLFVKETNNLYLVTDHLASFKIFYAQDDNKFIYSTDLFDITKFKNNLVNDLELDMDSVYFFLGFGSVVKDRTLFKDIKKIEPGNYLRINFNNDMLEVISYHELNFDKNNSLNESEIINKYQELISKPMDRIINLNNDYDLENIAGLSGGLDSKSMVVMMDSMAKSKLTTFTFAESGSLDQSIAQSVSNKLGSIHFFSALDNGNCLLYSFEDVIRNSNGLIAIHTLLHSYNAYRNLNCDPFGLLLTGQIGDAIFGSHFIGDKSVKDYITSKSHYGKVPDFICSKIGYMDDLVNYYSHGNSEAYIYEGRISNGTLYGDIINRSKIDTITPFYSKRLLDFTLTLPEKYRVDEYMYFKWLRKYNPETLNFKWDKCDCKPTSQFKVKIFKKIHTIKNALKKRLKLKYDGMNPFDVWFRETPEIMTNLDKLYESNIDVLNDYPELMGDVNRLFNSDVDRYKRNKFTVITLLLSLKMHQEK